MKDLEENSLQFSLFYNLVIGCSYKNRENYQQIVYTKRFRETEIKI